MEQMEQWETIIRSVLADVIGAIGIASAIVGLLLAIGLWAWYLWDTHRHPASSPGEKTGEHT